MELGEVTQRILREGYSLDWKPDYGKIVAIVNEWRRTIPREIGVHFDLADKNPIRMGTGRPPLDRSMSDKFLALHGKPASEAAYQSLQSLPEKEIEIGKAIAILALYAEARQYARH